MELDLLRISELVFTVDVQVAVFGIRNLLSAARKPIITLRLTNDPSNAVYPVKLEGINSKNPNFGQIVIFKKVRLPIEPLLWP